MKNARFFAALGVVLLVAAAAAAKLTIADLSFEPEQVAAVTANCSGCHGSVPDYGHVSIVHSKHASFACSRCHGADGALAVTDGLHTGIRWIGVGAVAAILTAIVANSFIVNKVGKGK